MSSYLFEYSRTSYPVLRIFVEIPFEELYKDDVIKTFDVGLLHFPSLLCSIEVPRLKI